MAIITLLAIIVYNYIVLLKLQMKYIFIGPQHT